MWRKTTETHEYYNNNITRSMDNKYSSNTFKIYNEIVLNIRKNENVSVV